MNIIANTRKSMLGIGLSLIVLLSGGAFLSANSAHAAAISTVSMASSKANAIIATGEQFMGVRYKWGAPAGRTDEFDCSSFVQYVFKQNGIDLPRSSKQQSKVGTYVPRNQLQPGDLIFFYNPIHHVAIYIGNGKILQTYSNPTGVTISNLNSGWWNTHYNTARRVLADSAYSPAVTPKPVVAPKPVVTPRPVVTPEPTATPTFAPTPSWYPMGDNYENDFGNNFWWF